MWKRVYIERRNEVVTMGKRDGERERGGGTTGRRRRNGRKEE